MKMAKEEKKEEEKKISEDRFNVVDVTTQTTPAVYDSVTDQQLDIFGALSELLNRIEKIEGAIVEQK